MNFFSYPFTRGASVLGFIQKNDAIKKRCEIQSGLHTPFNKSSTSADTFNTSSLYGYTSGILWWLLWLTPLLSGHIYAQNNQSDKLRFEMAYGNSHPLIKNMRSFDRNNPRAGFTRSGQLLEVALGVQVNSSTSWRLKGHMAFSPSDWAEERIDEIMEAIPPGNTYNLLEYRRTFNILGVSLSYRKEYHLKKHKQDKFFIGASAGILGASTPYSSVVWGKKPSPYGGYFYSPITRPHPFTLSPSFNAETGILINMSRYVYLLPQMQILAFYLQSKPLVHDDLATGEAITLPFKPIRGVQIFGQISLGLGFRF